MSDLKFIRTRFHPCEPNDPPICSIKSVYALENTQRGGTAFIICPGPSVEQFPLDKLKNSLTIGVNGVCEFFPTKYFIFAEWKVYHRLWKYVADPHIHPNLLTNEYLMLKFARFLPKGKTIYYYNHNIPIKRYAKGRKRKPWWHNPKQQFLPGHCTITSHAISLSQLMKTKTTILIGADQEYEGSKYYCKDVKINRGPWDRDHSLYVGRNWLNNGFKTVWRGMDIRQCGPKSTLNVPLISIDEALSFIET